MIEINTNKNLDLTVYTATGELLCYDIAAIANSFYSGEITKCVLWDLSKGTASQLSMNDVHSIVSLVKRMSESKRVGKTAIVVSSKIDYGLGRMLGILGEIEELPIEINIYYSLYEAKKWLEP